MMHAERISFNWLTGQKIWAFRDIQGDSYGDDWIASMVLIKHRWFSRRVKMILATNINTARQYREVDQAIGRLGFRYAYAVRHGRRRDYRVRVA